MSICPLCQKEIQRIDFTDIESLKQFTYNQEKLKPRRKTGLCTQHQKKITQAIKRARFLALMPYVN